MMANYTMTINECLNNPLTPIFNFDYPFYMDDEEAKAKFEEKFVLYYWNCEIGFETFARFQKALQSRLTIKMPYYQQLYETELASKDINFLLNKDLRETFTREIDTENQLSGTNTSTQNSSGTNSFNQTGSTNSTNSMSQNGTTTNTHKESAINDGVAVASLSDGYLTGTSSDSGTSTNGSTSSSNDDNESSGSSESSDNVETTGTSSQTGNEKMVEKTDLLSQGNIGITSSAELLQKWREVLINIDEIIIEDCRDLFMQLY